YFGAHQLDELWSGMAGSNDGFVHVETPQALQRQVDSSFAVIHSYVLPKVGELQRRASAVGELLALRVTVAADVEHEVADRIGRITTIAKQIVKRWIASGGLVLTERDEQIGEGLLGNIERAHSFAESYEYRMPRRLGVTTVKLCLPFVEPNQRLSWIANFVTQIIGDPAIRVDIEEMLAEMRGTTPGRDRKVFVLAPRQPLAVKPRVIKLRRYFRDGVTLRQSVPSA